MMHGPCGALDPKCPCMKDGKCSKRFPKSFQPATTFDADGFPIYRRRDTGVKARKSGVDLDNRWVVPHNLQILKKFQAHINVEACNQSYLIKYLFKYCNKGADAASLGVAADSSANKDKQPGNSEGVDEIAEYIKSRYLSWCEAVWRLLGFEIHEKFPAVERLHVHLPGMNIVAVSEEDVLEDVVSDPDSTKSTLTEWFLANQIFPAARKYTYCEFPNYYTWNNKRKTWEGHRRGTKIGRLRFIHPGVGDAFYLRMLLMVVRGAISYADVRTYEGVVHNTFRQACQARGLIGDDTEWTSLFDEAVRWANPFQLRSIFMTVLVYCDVGNVRALFDAYWKYMADDIKYRMRKNICNPNYDVPDSILLSSLLKELSSMFSNNGLSISSYDLPTSSEIAHDESSNRLILEELSYDRSALAVEAASIALALNGDQRSIYDSVISSVCKRHSFVYFIAGHGGTGKTFLWRAILARLRSQDHIVLAVASSGVAALLMPGGRTAHSRFRIPLDIHDRSICSIGRGTLLAALIQKTSLIIWDEAPMTHRFCFEALDRSLRDLLSANDASNAAKPFGGLPILLGGDFR